ncbi:high choriolytic enzyme 1-like isoform X1 [Halichoeres trimaculatus]|uniref:high choriolytic enzyme 1-like isoform X1 n=1 Tax=Halichoeres trimaculatus TaxID=147232 RepID=UPI003D9DDBE2
MSPSASLLLLLLLGLSQALPLQEEGSGELEDVDVQVPDTMDIPEEVNDYAETPDAMESPEEEEKDYYDEIPDTMDSEEEEDYDEEPDTMGIGSRILTTNNATDEILLEGDLLAPKTRNAIRCWYQRCLWRKSSNGLVIIPFTVSSQFTGRERQMMNYAMKAFHSKTCIRFIPRTNQRDFISIENRAGCYSNLGKAGGRQVLSLSRRGCLYHGIIQHEINHALGFQHEQTRSDRDRYVRINWQNINRKMAYNFYKQNTNNLNTPYDYSSIMHYDRTAFSIRRGRDSITPIPNPNVRIGQRRGMSYWDIQRINRLYRC